MDEETSGLVQDFRQAHLQGRSIRDVAARSIARWMKEGCSCDEIQERVRERSHQLHQSRGGQRGEQRGTAPAAGEEELLATHQGIQMGGLRRKPDGTMQWEVRAVLNTAVGDNPGGVSVKYLGVRFSRYWSS